MGQIFGTPPEPLIEHMVNFHTSSKIGDDNFSRFNSSRGNHKFFEVNSWEGFLSSEGGSKVELSFGKRSKFGGFGPGCEFWSDWVLRTVDFGVPVLGHDRLGEFFYEDQQLECLGTKVSK